MLLAAERPSLSALERLTDDTGLMEHAWRSIPRRDHGYCADDNGRALAVVSNVGGERAQWLAKRYLGFLRHSHLGCGAFRLRLGFDRRWTDDAHSDDADGRAILGISVAAARGPSPDVRAEAGALFDEVTLWRSSFWRATATAALGAAVVLGAHPEHDGARRMVEDAMGSLPRPERAIAWPWPDDRLGYENALLPHALIRLGDLLGDESAIRDGALLLRWLIDVESREDHFSFAPVGGRGPGERSPAFDQQPIEAWAMSEAAMAAMQVVPCSRFAWAVERAVTWFDGANDSGLAMIDPETGGGFDGLESSGVNLNQGAEAQLAVLAAQLVAFDYSREAQLARPLSDVQLSRASSSRSS